MTVIAKTTTPQETDLAISQAASIANSVTNSAHFFEDIATAQLLHGFVTTEFIAVSAQWICAKSSFDTQAMNDRDWMVAA